MSTPEAGRNRVVSAGGSARLTSRSADSSTGRAVAHPGQLDPQRQPGLGIGPDVHPGDAGGPLGRGEAYAGGGDPGHPTGRQRATARHRVRPAASAGPGSAAAGRRRRAAGSPRPGEIVATSDSNTQRIMIGPRRIRSVSPVLRIRSIRQSSAARHHTRRSLSSPSSWASPTKESLSGTCRAPEVSTYPDHGRSADAWMRATRSAGLTPGIGDRPGLQGHGDTDQRGGRDQHDQPARSHARQRRWATPACPSASQERTCT